MRVLKQMMAEKEKIQAESILNVCSDLIDLDTTSLTIKILKHVGYCMMWHIHHVMPCYRGVV